MTKKLLMIPIAVVMLSLLIYAHAFAADESRTLGISTENPEDTLEYNMSEGIGVITGITLIEYDDLKARGRDLHFDEKYNLASMAGAPAVTVTLGETIDAEFGKIAFDMNRNILFASGGCVINSSGASGTANLKTDSVVVNTAEKWLRSKGAVKITYAPPEKKAAENKKRKTADGKEAAAGKKNIVDLGVITITSGPVYFEMETGVITAAGPVRIDFDDGFMTAGALSGNVKNRVFDLTGGITGKAGDTTLSADGAVVDYMKKEITATGNVAAQQEKSDRRINAASVWVKFAEDDRRMTASKINMTIKVEQKKKPVEGDNVPKGEAP